MLRAVNGALTEKRTLRGGGALQFLDLRLFEDGGEREGTLVSDSVPVETANEGRSRNGVGEQTCQWALTRKRTLGAAAH